MANPNFDPEYSSNSVWYNTNMNECLTDHIDDMESDINGLQSSKANTNHVHTAYASVNHTHSYNDLENKPSIPTTLPANGGNADTLDGQHASEFAASAHTHSKSQISGLTEPSDYVIASGLSGQWVYRKWNSGISECWRQISGTITHYSTWNGFKVFAGSLDWPTGLFVANPIATYTCYFGNGYAIAARGSLSTTTKFNWEALGTDGDSNITYCIDVYAIGRWK